MSAEHYAMAAYAAGLGLMLGYGLLLWAESRLINRRHHVGDDSKVAD